MGKKNVEPVVSAMGWLMAIITALSEMVKDRGANVGEVFAHLASAEGKKILGKIVDLIVSPGKSFAELLTACRHDDVSSDFTEGHFPLVDDGTIGPIETYCFGRKIVDRQVVAELKKLGFTPVGIRRGMGWIADHPDAQLDSPMIMIGARWASSVGIVCVPFFCGNGDKRYLDLCDIGGHDFGPHIYFLVSRESKPLEI